MQKFLKLSTVSMLTIVAATGANAAGYTCEELIEYTSCNDGYYLNSGDCIEGATCGAGNYLVGTCPSGYYEEDPDEGRYLVTYRFDTGWCYMDSFYNVASEEECTSQFDEENGLRGKWYGSGCVSSNEDFVAAESYTCTSCASGTYQPSAGQYSCITCPAGSECPTTTAATLCEIGTYSSAGATACTICPATGLTDKDGNTVVATTASTGSDSLAACIVGPDVQFKNDAGIYHFKSNCMTDWYVANAESDCGPGYVLAWEESVDITGGDRACVRISESKCAEFDDTAWNSETQKCECTHDEEHWGTWSGEITDVYCDS